MRSNSFGIGFGLVCFIAMAINGCDCGPDTSETFDAAAPRRDAAIPAFDSGADAAQIDSTPGQDAGGQDSGAAVDSSATACEDDALEDNDDLDQATQLAPGTVSAAVCAGDEDWFAVTANANETITARAEFSHSDGDIDLVLLDPQDPSTPIATSESTDDNEEAQATVSAAGTYYVVVILYSGDRNRYSLTVTVEEGVTPTCTDDSLEENDTQGTATAVAAGAHQGTICGGDPDYFGIALNTGDVLSAELAISSAGADLDVQVLAPDGTEVGASTGATQAEHLEVTAAAAGTYAVRIYGKQASDESEYALTLAVTPGTVTCDDDGFEENDDADHPAAITAGTYQGQICAGDEDWFGLTLQPGDQVTVEATFSHAAGDLSLQLLRPDRQVLATGGSSSDNEQIAGVAAQGGVFLVRVYGATGQAENAYGLIINVTTTSTCANDAFEPNDSAAQASALAAGQHPGKLCPGDEDWYQVTLNTGDTIAVGLDFAHASGNIDLKLYDGAGQTLLASSLTTTDDESLSFVATASGAVLVQVVGAEPMENAYQMTITVTPGTGPCADDALEDNDTAATAAPLAAGDYDAIVCPGDDDFYAVDLNVGDDLAAQIDFTNSAGDLDLQLLNPAGDVVASSTSGSQDTESAQHTATVAGQFVLRVYGYRSAGNDYQLSVTITTPTPTCRDDAFEENDTAAAAAAITAGTYPATVCPSDDDFYAFDLNVGDVVDASITFTVASGDLDLQLLNPAGAVVAASTTASSSTEQVQHEALVAGTFVLRAFGYREASNDYQLALDIERFVPVCREDAFEENDSQAQAAGVTAGTVQGQICSGDEDWFAINLNAGDLLDLNLYFEHAGGDLDLQLTAPDGTVERSSFSTNDNEEILDYTAEEAGLFGVRVRGYNQAENGYDLVIDVVPFVPACPEDGFENNDTAATATAFPGGTVNAQICAGDSDYFAVNLNAGDVLDVTLAFSDALGDLDLVLRDPQDNTVAWSVSTTDNEQLSYEAPDAGRYTVRVYGMSGVENSYGLTLAITPVTPVCQEDGYEENDTRQTATPYTGAAIAGQICAADDDWVSVVLNVGDRVQANLDFSHAAGDLDMALYNGAGAFVTSSATSSDDENIDYTAAAAGTFALRIYGYRDAENAYILNLTLTPAVTGCQEDGYENNDTQATAVALPSASFSGQICEGDDDYFFIDLNAGETLVLDLLFTHADGDLELRLYDQAGATVASSRTSTDNERISFPVPIGGSYAVRVYGYLGAENSYQLQSAVSADLFCPADDALEPNDDRGAASTAVPGTIVGIVCSGDDDYFAVDLPAGGLLRATLTFSQAEGDLDLLLYDGAGIELDRSEYYSPERVSGYSDTATTLYVLVRGYSGASASYALELALEQSPFYRAGAPKGCPGDDTLGNGDVLSARQLDDDHTAAGLICGDAQDWYAVSLAVGDTVTASLTFAQAVGDLDLFLVGPNGDSVTEAVTEDDDEFITFTAPSGAPGDYFFVVDGYSGAENWYDFSVSYNRVGGSCVEDPGEPDDSRSDATTLLPGFSRGGQLCSGDEDYYYVNVASGETLVATLMFEHAQGDLELRLLDDNSELDRSTTTADLEQVSDTAVGSTNYFVVVYGFQTASGAYTLLVDVE